MHDHYRHIKIHHRGLTNLPVANIIKVWHYRIDGYALKSEKIKELTARFGRTGRLFLFYCNYVSRCKYYYNSKHCKIFHMQRPHSEGKIVTAYRLGNATMKE